MKKAVLPLLLAVALGGCATAMSPVNGSLYSNISGPLLATDNPEKPSKIGRASMRTIMGVYAVGDASIDAAAKNAGITRIHHVDYETESVFGIVADFTVVVYGN